MGKTVLTADQRAALEIFKAERPLAELFYLTGGTALAEYYFSHRYSDDLDFFTGEKEFPQLAIEALAGKIKALLGAQTLEYRRLYDRRIFFLKKDGGELKMEFTYYPFPHLQKPEAENGILIDSLHDIAANKLMALIDRLEGKDFADLYVIIEKGKLPLSVIRTLAEKKFGYTIDTIALGSELAKVSALTALPKMILPLTLPELKSFFEEETKKLKPEIMSE